MAVKFLSSDQIVHMHNDLIDRWGGEHGGGHRGHGYEGVEAAAQAVKNSYYTEFRDLAAAYAVYIIQGHVFMDGNKRSGLAAMTTFLDANGVKYRAVPDEMFKAMIELQTRSEAGERTDHLISWLASLLE